MEDAIRINDLKTVEDITGYTKAGGFCKSCIKPGGHDKREYYLVDILARVRAEMEHERNPDQALSTDFSKLSVVKQIKAIEVVLDEQIRPALASDGGGIELEDVQNGGNGRINVHLRYQGSCKGCAGSQASTLRFVEQTLRKHLSDKIYGVVV